ncbi:MAG: thioredoxin 1 [Bacteroidetes bacterium HGW-Bacteroidetes-4]|jgi:thioredoxin|nr:MAG: thioredoxin 1 [Bacteroidetes bacterium HGW-Bacteroidetes-4]
MNRFFLLPVLLVFFVSAYAQQSSYKNLNSQEFSKIIQDSKGTLLDVRTPSEFANSHIANAGQLNYYAFDFEQKLLLLPKNQPVYLYCNTGYRSKRAAEILTKNGYTQVYNLEKGIMDWNLYNFPVAVEPNAQPDTDNKMEPDEFFALIKSNKPVFVDFYAPWCAPCRKMMPMMDSLKEEYKGKITVVKINADASKKLIKELQLGSVPYLVLYQRGKKTFEHKGIISRSELENQFTRK